jgi:dipeptidase
MCDTFVVLGNSTLDGSVIFGKNSDREPNEAHELLHIPHMKHHKGSEVACTYIRIPQVEETNAVLLAKPFWIWGAEMGANEHGVVIGNEALFTKIPYDKEPGLIGMDFLRLALERGNTADEALEVMIDLLEKYGQGGDCGFAHHLFYHNGFLIADRQSAWVFETAGKHWAVEKVKNYRTISNSISIGSSWDRASDALVSNAIASGWCKDEDDFDFGRCYSDFIFTKFSDGRKRQCRTMNLLEENLNKIDLPFAMQLLRDHGSDADAKWQPGKGLFGAEVCMHASFGPVRVSQTTGSFIAHLTANAATYWVTGTSSPCTSTFKPVWFDSGLPNLGPQPNGNYDAATLWWRHENLHREILRDYALRVEKIRINREILEAKIREGVADLVDETSSKRSEFTRKCFEDVESVEREWLENIQNSPIRRGRSWLDKLAWKKFDRNAQRI